MTSKSNNDFSTVGGDSQINGFSKHSSSAVSNVLTYMKDLDRIQEQQALYASKIEKERQRSVALSESIQSAKETLVAVKARTKNGKVVKEEGIAHSKLVHKIEHQVQMAKIKLSGSRGENMNLKKKIDQLRMDKLLYTKILQDSVSKTDSCGGLQLCLFLILFVQ